MQLLRAKFAGSSTAARAVPFLVFVGLTFFQGKVGPTSPYWVYLGKTLVGTWLIWLSRPWVPEMEWRFSGAAVLVGVGVFGLWVGLDGLYPSLSQLAHDWLGPPLRAAGLARWAPDPGTPPAPWNPLARFGPHSGLAWLCVVGRLGGSSLVVPPLEEVFYRSFLYRYLVKVDFLALPLARFRWRPFLAVSILFGVSHYEWLPGILCGFAYQGLVCWKGRLGDAMTAHALTNLLLGLWVVSRGAWQFW